MRRRISTLGSALSLLLCAATVVVWVRSYPVGDQIARTHLAREIRFVSLRGMLCVAWGQRYQGVPGKSGWRYEGLRSPLAYDWPYPSGLDHVIGTEELGVRWGGAGGIAWNVVVCPCWLACLLFLLLPAKRPFRAYRRWRAQRLRMREHRCPSCGYDLRASPERCPECGTPARSPPLTASPPVR